MKKQFKVAPSSANPTTEELADSIADGGQIVDIVAKPLADGFQIPDLFAGLQAEPIGRELFRDVPVLYKTFLSMPAADAKTAAIKAHELLVERVGELAPATKFYLSIFYNAASSYAFADSVYRGGKLEVEQWQKLGRGGFTLPALAQAA